MPRHAALPLHERPFVDLSRRNDLTVNVQDRRARLRNLFAAWLRIFYSLTYRAFLVQPLTFVNAALEKYVQYMYDQGNSIFDSSETLNALVDDNASWKGHLLRAWRSIKVWKDLHPWHNHIPCPIRVWLAMVSLSCLWSWPSMAVCLLIAFSGMMRPGEVVGLRLEDLMFPDTGYQSVDVLFVRVQKPKMRRLNARREFVKITDPYVCECIRRYKVGRDPKSRLWKSSYASFSQAHAALVSFFGLSIKEGEGITPASHRTGAATYYFACGESLSWIRWHGRWATERSLEVYIQESAASLFWSQLGQGTKELICQFAEHTTNIIQNWNFA